VTGYGRGGEGPRFRSPRDLALAQERRQSGVRPGPPRLPDAFFGSHNNATTRLPIQGSEGTLAVASYHYYQEKCGTQIHDPESQTALFMRESIAKGSIL